MKNLNFLKRVLWLMIPLLTLFNQVALAAAGDEVTSVSGITSGKWYYIKGVRSDGSTVEYLTFDDATNVLFPFLQPDFCSSHTNPLNGTSQPPTDII